MSVETSDQPSNGDIEGGGGQAIATNGGENGAEGAYAVDAQAAEVQPAEAEEGEAEAQFSLDIVINNVVSSFSVGCHVDLRKVALTGSNVEHKRDKGMVSMKIRNPYATASIWSSGKITSTGSTSEEMAKKAARKFSRILQNIGFKVRFCRFKVVNVLGTCTMPWAIRLEALSEAHPNQSSYEPELHPGLTFKIKELKATLKVFSTGSITITAPCVTNVQLAVEHIYPIVYEHQRELTERERDRRDAIAELKEMKRMKRERAIKRYQKQKQRRLKRKKRGPRRKTDDKSAEDASGSSDESESDDDSD